MVALPTGTDATTRAMDAHHEAKQDREPYAFIRGSASGEPCERKVWYTFRWSMPPETFPGQQLRLFETGNREEARLIVELRNAGVNVQDRDPATGDQWRVTACDGHYRGHADGIVTGLVEAPKTPHLLEVKTHGQKSFDQLLKHGLAASKPEHVAQMQFYMGGLGLTRGFYLAKNKNTDALYSERLHFDPAHYAALVARAERIKDAHQPPARVSDDPTYYWCKSYKCPAYGLCHERDFALRNCRTCINSTPVHGGRWMCDLHKRELSYDDQRAGCGDHIYLPELVPGEVVEVSSSGKQSITYRLDNGETWTDGMRR